MATTPLPLPEVLAVAAPIVERIVWCTVASAGTDGQPRTRLMHPVWSWSDDDVPTALVSARPTPVKVAHLRANPQVSCFYWDPSHDTVAIDATAEWAPADARSEVWERIATVPPPVGFDPSMIWPDGPDSEDCGFLALRAHRIVATPVGGPGVRWSTSRP